MNSTLYKVGRFICKAFFRIFYRVNVIGSENIPKQGGVLLCSNHIHLLDPPFLGSFIKRHVRFMAKSELFEVPILKGLLPKLGAFPINRGKSDRQALRTALKLLKEEEVIGIFPEGTRSKTGQLGEGLSGVGFFALRSDAHVVPCAIVGNYKIFSKLYIIYGEPLQMDTLRENKASADEATEKIMQGIQDIIDEYNK